jgi:hypothetical protein
MFGGAFQFLCKYLYNGFDAPEPPDPAALVIPDFVVMFQVVFLLMLGKIGAEALGGHRLSGVVITPQLINSIEILGGDLGICFETEVAFRFHELHNVVAFLDGRFHIYLHSFTDGEVVIVPDQPSKTFQSP